jgi:DOPA 4,5-dioxygenase
MTTTQPFQIQGYHVHVYCDLSQTSLCQDVRTQLLKDLSSIEGAGPVRNRPVGPHPLPMFEAWFQPEAFDEVKNWMQNNRKGLTVMFHPLTGNDYNDHADHAIWLGEPLPLNLEILR